MLKFLLCLTSLFLLASCSGPAGTYKVYWESLGTAFSAIPDAVITREQVAATPYSLLLVKPGEAATAVMALAYLEHGQEKWISSDDAMLIVEHGRIVKTLGFSNDLLAVTQRELDPLKAGSALLSTATPWQRLLDFKLNNLQAQNVSSVFRYAGEQTLVILQRDYLAELFVEEVSFTDADKRLTNKFWFDKTSGKLLRSEQYLSPSWPVFQLTFLSNAL